MAWWLGCWTHEWGRGFDTHTGHAYLPGPLLALPIGARLDIFNPED